MHMNEQQNKRRHLDHVFAHTVASIPDGLAVIFEDQRLTWREVAEQVSGLAKSLLALGIQRGDRIGVLSPPRPEYLITYLAASRIGAILTGFSIQYTAREIIDYAKLVHPVAMIVVPELGVGARVGELCKALPFVEHRISIGSAPADGLTPLHELIEQGQALPDGPMEERAAQLREDDGAFIVFTGGSTGMPKPALLSHKNIVTSVIAQNRTLGFTSSDRLISHLPMNHVSGAVLVTSAAIQAGVTLVMLERFHPVKTMELLEREKVTLLGQVPTMYAMELMLPNFKEYDLSSLRELIIAGAPTPEPVMRMVATMAPLAIHAYGLTEATGMVAYTAPGDSADVLVQSVGRVIDEADVRIVDAAHRPLPANEVGEIALRGDVVMIGYYGHPEETARQIDDAGWFYTGDMGKLDERNYLHILGRKKEMYISGGYNVYPLEVESYMDTHPDVMASACIGRPDPVMGETGVIFVTLMPGAETTRRELRAYCKLGLARYKQPRYIYVLDALPTTAVGKVDKQALARMLAAEENAGVGKTAPG
jgi:acyl-CoA synthetase (AMP-forming)/AMP-acid ligase II